MSEQTPNGNGEFKGYAKTMIDVLKERLEDFQEQINQRFCEIDYKLSELKNNHLAHLEDEIEKLNERIDKNTRLLVSTLLTAFVALIIEFIRRF